MEKKLYILLDENGKVTGQNYFVIGQQPLLSTDILPTQNFIVGYFNKQTGEYYEGATEQEIKDYNKKNMPFSVTRRQLKQSLVISQISLDAIDSAIAQISDDTERILMKLFWEESYEFERQHPKLIEFSNSLGISENQVDEIFILASKL